MPDYSEGIFRAWIGNQPHAPEGARQIDTYLQQWSFQRKAKSGQTVTLSGGGYTALTVPSGGAYGLTVLLPATGADQLTLKGVTGDQGIKVTGTYRMPLVVPIDVTVTAIGFNNAAVGPIDVTVFWF